MNGPPRQPDSNNATTNPTALGAASPTTVKATSNATTLGAASPTTLGTTATTNPTALGAVSPTTVKATSNATPLGAASPAASPTTLDTTATTNPTALAAASPTTLDTVATSNATTLGAASPATSPAASPTTLDTTATTSNTSPTTASPISLSATTSPTSPTASPVTSGTLASTANVSASSIASGAAAIYMHLPWCMRKCPYCDFNSHKAPESIPQSRYVDALLKDLRAELRRAARLGVEYKCISTIFIGGGTPSLFDPDNIIILLQGINARVPLAADCEITLEANPGALESARLYGFRRAGINRLSLGVQSLNDKFLRIIGREHDSAQARVAIEQALCAGFGRVNIDLMYGLPGQSTEEALEDLAAAGRFNLNHLSWYELTIEPNTAFGWRPPAGLPDEEKSLAMREAGHAFLHAAGLNSYEVSAWAGSPDDRCRHNLNYWNYGDYIGIGAGAHGKLTLSDTGQVLRSRKTRSPLSYMKQCLDVTATTDEGSLDTLAEESHELVDPERACDEFLLNALRLTDGFSLDVWQQRTRTNAQVLIDATADLVKSGHLRLENNRLAATTTAAAMLDEIIADVCILVDSSRAGHPGTAPKRTDTTTTGNGNATTGRTDTTTTGNGNATTGHTDTTTTGNGNATTGRTDATTTSNGNATTGRTDTTTTGNGNATTGRTDTVTT